MEECLHNQITGRGTYLTNCQFCGKPMLSGNLVRHWQSGECKHNRSSWMWMETFKVDRQKFKKRRHRVLGI